MHIPRDLGLEILSPWRLKYLFTRFEHLNQFVFRSRIQVESNCSEEKLFLGWHIQPFDRLKDEMDCQHYWRLDLVGYARSPPSIYAKRSSLNWKVWHFSNICPPISQAFKENNEEFYRFYLVTIQFKQLDQICPFS